MGEGTSRIANLNYKLGKSGSLSFKTRNTSYDHRAFNDVAHKRGASKVDRVSNNNKRTTKTQDKR